MKAHLDRIISMLLLCALFINTFGIAYAAETDADALTSYNVPLSSNECPDQSSVTVYGYNGGYFIALETIAQFTRFSYCETETHLKLVQGVREVEIEKSSGHLLDSDYIDQGIIELLEHDGKYYCEGIPMLLYLGAACTITDENKLEVLMPPITVWESIMPDYIDFYFNIVELYGGETNVKISLVCDILSDLLDAVSGHGLKADGDTHLEDALYEILNVDISKYGSVQEHMAADNKKIQNFLKTNEDLINQSGDNGKDVLEIAEEYLDFYFNSKIAANEFKWQTVYQSGNVTEASKLSSEINQQVYKQSVASTNLNKAGDILNLNNIGMIAFSTALTSYNLMQYDEDTRNIFNRTINNEMMDYVDYHDISWNNVTDKISRTLSSNTSIVRNTAVDNIVDFAIGEISDKGVEMALNGFVENANIYILAVKIGGFISSLINSGLHEAYSADMNAIWLSTVQYDVAQLVSRLLVNEAKNNGCKNFGDTEYLQRLRDLFILYYRTTIAFAENMAVSIDEFGGKNKSDWVRYFSDTSGASVGNYAAAYLYRMTNCTLVPIVDYHELEDTVINETWIGSTSSDSNPSDVEIVDVLLSHEEMWADQIYKAEPDEWTFFDFSQFAYFHDFDFDGIPEFVIQSYMFSSAHFTNRIIYQVQGNSLQPIQADGWDDFEVRKNIETGTYFHIGHDYAYINAGEQYVGWTENRYAEVSLMDGSLVSEQIYAVYKDTFNSENIDYYGSIFNTPISKDEYDHIVQELEETTISFGFETGNLIETWDSSASYENKKEILLDAYHSAFKA